MDKLVQLITQKVGISESQARQPVAMARAPTARNMPSGPQAKSSGAASVLSR